jgi:hypothetical protein
MGGWRFNGEARAVLGHADLVVELKRMYVVATSRGRGHWSTLLGAGAAGRVLVVGTRREPG